MSDSRNRPGPLASILVGLILLAMVGSIVAACLPLWDCPASRHAVQRFSTTEVCPICREKGRISLLQKWFGLRSPEEQEALKPLPPPPPFDRPAERK
jgi:hypothetical protein